MVSVGIEGNSIFVPSPSHSLGLVGPSSLDDTAVDITTKKNVVKIEIKTFFILLSYTKFFWHTIYIYSSVLNLLF